MTRIIDRLDEISGDYAAVLCDLWGCLHDGVQAFEDAVAALVAFREGGGKVVLLTNAPRPRPQVVAQLDRLGVPRDAWDDVVTSGDSAQAALVAGAVGHRVYHIGPQKDLSFFSEMADDLDPSTIERVALEEAEGIVCTGLVDDATESPEDYRAPLLYAKAKGLKLLCANPDIFVHKGGQRLWCAGALAALYTEMGGQSLYFGKPHPPIYDLARRRLAALAPVEDAAILAIGDGPSTDMAGAQGEGLDFVFVTAGVARADLAPGRPEPTALKKYLDDRRMAPRFAMERLA